MQVPVIELSECVRCEICVEISPSVFSISSSGYVQVADLDEYPLEEVTEAIKNCPADCISWQDQ